MNWLVRAWMSVATVVRATRSPLIKGATLPSPVPPGSSRSPAHLYASRSSLRASCTRRRRARYRDHSGRVRVAPLHTSSGATGGCADVRQRLAAWTCTAREPLPRYHDCADEPEYVALRLHVDPYRFSHCHGKHESSAASAGISRHLAALASKPNLGRSPANPICTSDPSGENRAPPATDCCTGSGTSTPNLGVIPGRA